MKKILTAVLFVLLVCAASASLAQGTFMQIFNAIKAQ